MLAVRVSAFDGSTAAYECNADDTVLDVKVRVAADEGLPSSRVTLLSGGSVLKNEISLATMALDESVDVHMVKDCERKGVGKVECLSSSGDTWDTAVEELALKLARAGVEQGQVFWIDTHNRNPSAVCVVSAHFSRDIVGRGTLCIGHVSRAGRSWEELYAWADTLAVGKEIISISGASSNQNTHGVAGANFVLYVFHYVGETVPAAPVEHICAAAGSWNGAGFSLLSALLEAGVERGQLLGIDAHNDNPDAPATFTAHICKGLPGYGPLALAMDCSANEADTDWAILEGRVAEQSTGRDLVLTTGSSNCDGRVVLYCFWHVPDDHLEFCIVETAPGTWRAAAEALVSRLCELNVSRSEIVSIDAHNKGFGQPCVLSAHYRQQGDDTQIAPPLQLAWELQESDRENWPYLRGWVNARATGKDVISITGASGTLEGGGRGKSMLLFYHIPAAGETCQNPATVQSMQSAAGWWNGAANRLLDSLSGAGIEREHIISISACNAHPTADAEFQAHFCSTRGGSGRRGRVAYQCFNHDAPWKVMHYMASMNGSGRDVISVTGSSNESGRSVLYIFYWEEA